MEIGPSVAAVEKRRKRNDAGGDDHVEYSYDQHGETVHKSLQMAELRGMST